MFSSGSLNDGKAAIPLLKGIDERLSLPSLHYQIMDAGSFRMRETEESLKNESTHE